MQYERWAAIRLSPWRWYAVALPAALIAGLTGIGALTAGTGPGRGAVAVQLALLVAIPYALLMLLEARAARRLERARELQLRLMREEREWRAMSAWEMSDRIAWLLSTGGVRVDWIPTPMEAETAPFAAVGRHPAGGRMLVHVAKGPLLRADMERTIGQAVLEGAQTLVFVAPSGAEEKVRSIIAHGAQAMDLELWGLQEILMKAEGLSQPA